MRSDKWEGFVDFCRKLAEHRKTGRASLRREWRHLRDLTEQVAANIPDELVHDLLGKSWATVDPEENDLKALLSYAVGQGLLAPEQVRDALEADNTQSPLFWLAGLSGKTFGESVAPELCAYWIQENGDRWEKQPGTEYYDIAWTPVAIYPLPTAALG